MNGKQAAITAGIALAVVIAWQTYQAKKAA
jgi:hypothetical protein